MITHVRVRYEDDKKIGTVPIEDVKDFFPRHQQDFKSKSLYLVKWTDDSGDSDYYRARILALGESEDFAETEARERTRIPKRVYSPASSDYENEAESPIKEKTKNKTTSGAEARLLQLLKSKKENMKRQAKNQDGPHSKKHHKEAMDSGRLQGAHETIDNLEEQVEKKSTIIRQLRKQNEEKDREMAQLRRLNMELQDKVISALEDMKGCRIMKRIMDGSQSSPSVSEDLQDTLTERALRPGSSNPQPNDSETMVDIGRGLMVKKGAWEHVQSHHKDSLFVKDLLVTIWSKDNLKERSLHGKHCPRYPNRPRKAPLTPWKLDVMRDCYRARLEHQGVPAGVLPLAVKQMNHFIVEKLSDIEKLAKRAKDNQGVAEV
ncbi:hypothetical protein HPB51_025492 [Rhipicephalus microplus]|uniref:BEN domain-containing protein 5-like n=2 Tax=Rhipicephalus microplus TaxID=6941 RepID=A0A9J6EJU7_RHIMP|nr:BEN domain-containing protein 5-like [Rhipicephalus microplus]XP_037269769.1 BEN domain-containing protein 5-like [Rhipicephalus microplus]XP_037269789.1 BEN domain-containing protein 5-like [Rhipicephalus microplus]XP_037270066.1 BEN domain-containing protein 5-like [Rhipicephalus microplus]XP_037270765.1 BEN domain-containing protein 5-like [Rhipicephalus microplus]XP_037271508.1 BEN domain-containing protein 5-like [Rhipicephalus microplus]XP_037271745.1 BEN domain-containing protein 5-